MWCWEGNAHLVQSTPAALRSDICQQSIDGVEVKQPVRSALGAVLVHPRPIGRATL